MRTLAGRFILIAIISLAVLICDESFASGDDLFPKDRIVAEYDHALSELEAYFANVSGSGHLISRDKIGSPESRERSSRISFAMAQDQAKSIVDRGRAPDTIHESDVEKSPATKVDSPKAPTGEWVLVYNRAYGMELGRDSPDAPYMIRYFGREIDPIRKNIDRLSRGWYCMTNTGLWSARQVIALPHFTVERTRLENRADGKRYLRFYYSIAPDRDLETKQSGGLILRSGWIEVCLDQHWAIHASRQRLSSRLGTTLVRSSLVEYIPGESSFPIPKRSTNRLIHYAAGLSDPPDGDDTKGQLREETVLTFDDFHVGQVPDREFTAAAFGLPEIAVPGKQRYANRTGPWLITLAVAAFVGAIGLRYWATRRKVA